MLTEALTTAATLRLMSSSALTRSRSEWSMMAISPGLRRLVMFFVRRSTRAAATMPGGSLAFPRGSSGIFTDGAFIEFHPARAETCQWPCWPLRRVIEHVTERHLRSRAVCRKLPAEPETFLRDSTVQPGRRVQQCELNRVQANSPPRPGQAPDRDPPGVAIDGPGEIGQVVLKS